MSATLTRRSSWSPTPFAGEPADHTVCDFRLSTESGVAVSQADRTSQPTAYLINKDQTAGQAVPGGTRGRIGLWDGSAWVIREPTSEQTVSLGGLVSNTNYDIFAYDSSGTVLLEVGLPWTNDTTRHASATIGLTDGVLTNTADRKRRYLGTVRGSGTGVTEDSLLRRFLWNLHNRVMRPMRVAETSDNWTYNTETWRSANNSIANRVQFVRGLALDSVSAIVCCKITATANVDPAVGIGLDRTNACDAQLYGTRVSSTFNQAWAQFTGNVGQGFHYLQWIEITEASGTTTYYAGTPGTTRRAGGLNAETLF